MTRWLAGSFASSRHPDPARIAGALAPHTASLLDHGPLRVACSGPPAHTAEPLCLLSGHIDNAAELDAMLAGWGSGPGAAREPAPDYYDADPEMLRAPFSPHGAPEELLARGYRRWGIGLLPRLRGEFALLIWDRERQQGLLARDQLGIRAIFLHSAATGVLFATEMRHLLALLPSRPAPDPVTVAHRLAMSNRPGSATLYAGVRRLEPGTALVLDRDGIREQRYWAPRFAEPLDPSEPQLAGRVRAALEVAVRRRIGADGRTGVLMSGGLDSATVAAVAARQAPDLISVYSGIFPEHPAIDESALIDELREHLELDGAAAEVWPGGLLASASEHIQAWQMPPVGWGDFWMLPLARAASQAGVSTLLGGDGGDELFGSRIYLLADRLRAGRPREALALTLRLPGAGAHPPRREVAEVLGRFALLGALPYGLHRVLRRPFAARELPGWLRPRTAHDLLASDDPLAWKRLDGPRWWAEVAHGLTRGVDEGGIFEHQRRRAALAGLEARHPLFDLDLVELGLRQPPQATFDRDRNRPVLRASMAGLLPDSVRMRPVKAWFDSLITDCLTGPDGATVRRLLTDPGAQLAAYVDIDKLDRSLFGADAEPARGSFRWMHQIWRLAVVECWLRAQADPGGSVLPADCSASPARIRLRPLRDVGTHARSPA